MVREAKPTVKKQCLWGWAKDVCCSCARISGNWIVIWRYWFSPLMQPPMIYLSLHFIMLTSTYLYFFLFSSHLIEMPLNCWEFYTELDSIKCIVFQNFKLGLPPLTISRLSEKYMYSGLYSSPHSVYLLANCIVWCLVILCIQIIDSIGIQRVWKRCSLVRMRYPHFLLPA